MTRQTHLIPASIRAEVIERDGGCCRVCGRYADPPGLHHIEYKSEGGLDVVENLVVVGWTPGHDCHLDVVHRNKRVWQPLLKQLVHNPEVTGYQLRRWSQQRAGQRW